MYWKRKPSAPKAGTEPRKPKPCQCGRPGVYGVNIFGIPSDEWQCRDCYEKALSRNVRDDAYVRYGDKPR